MEDNKNSKKIDLIDEIPSEDDSVSPVRDGRLIPETPGFNLVPKITLESVTANYKKSHTTGYHQERKNSMSLEDMKEHTSKTLTPFMNEVKQSKFFQESLKNNQHLKVDEPKERIRRPKLQQKSQINLPHDLQ